MFLDSRGRPVRMDVNLAAICEPIVYRPPACYWDSFTLLNKILTFIPYSQLVLCVYTLYSPHHNMFRLHRAILR
jgi:hypothetical protein